MASNVEALYRSGTQEVADHAGQIQGPVDECRAVRYHDQPAHRQEVRHFLRPALRNDRIPRSPHHQSGYPNAGASPRWDPRGNTGRFQGGDEDRNASILVARSASASRAHEFHIQRQVCWRIVRASGSMVGPCSTTRSTRSGLPNRQAHHRLATDQVAQENGTLQPACARPERPDNR